MKYKLVIFDIDGTIVPPVSSWRFVHEKLGLWDKRAHQYQDMFLSGKISYKKFCELDAQHWKGLPERKVKEIFQRVRYAKNVRYCMKMLKQMGFKLVAISTGLQYLAERVKKELKFDYVISNRLLTRKGILTGGVKIHVGHGEKGKIFRKIVKRFAVNRLEVISVGDGSGDAPLAIHSGYSIAFNSEDKDFCKLVDYNCKSRDFKEVLERIVSISRNGTD